MDSRHLRDAAGLSIHTSRFTNARASVLEAGERRLEPRSTSHGRKSYACGAVPLCAVVQRITITGARSIRRALRRLRWSAGWQAVDILIRCRAGSIPTCLRTAASRGSSLNLRLRPPLTSSLSLRLQNQRPQAVYVEPLVSFSSDACFLHA